MTIDKANLIASLGPKKNGDIKNEEDILGDFNLEIDHLKNNKKEKFGSYVAGSIPLPWVIEACSLGGGSAKLAWLIWFYHTYNNPTHKPFKLSNIRANFFHMTRKTKKVAMDKLKNAGLIKVTEMGQGRSPLVEVIIRKKDYIKIYEENDL